MPNVFHAMLFIAGALFSWALVLEMRHLAPSLSLLDVPNQRSMHRQATPRGGGVAIVAVTLGGIAVTAVFGTTPEWPAFSGYLVGAALIAAISFADDIATLPSGIRLVAHFLGGAMMVAGLLVASELIPGARADLRWLVFAAALLWTVGLTNAYNFMDGIDGLAATQGVVGGLGWTLLAFLSHEPWIAVLSLLVAAGCSGFVLQNWPPAKIFMGDVGSAFLGFTFAFITLSEMRRTPQVALVGALLLWPFLFDAVFTLLRRGLRGEDVFVAHRSHLYQRLVLAGWRQSIVTVLYSLLALVAFALGAVWLSVPSTATALLLITGILLLPIGLWSVVIRAEHNFSRPPDPRPLMGR